MLVVKIGSRGDMYKGDWTADGDYDLSIAYGLLNAYQARGQC